MKKKNFLWSLLTMIMVCMLSVSLISCGGDDNDDPNNGQPVNPGTNVNDPTGTVSLAMRNTDNGNTYLDNIRIKNENFIGASFVSLGAVRGLGNVSTIPTSGWADQVAVEPGYGYVAFSNNQFYRIYVVDNIVNTSGGVIGADIKYQKPFKGSDEAISIDEKSLTFGNSGGSQSLVFNNKNIILFEATSDQSWCKVSKSSTHNNYFLYNAVTINVDPSSSTSEETATVTLTTVYNKTTSIKVTRTGASPTIELSKNEHEITPSEQTFQVGINSNLEMSNLKVEGANSWLTAKIVDGSSSMKAKASKIKFIGNKVRSQVSENNNSAKSYYLEMTAKSNFNQSNRQATVYVKSIDGKVSKSLVIKQQGATLSTSQSNYELVITAKEQSKDFSFTTNMNQTDLQVTSSESWLTIKNFTNKIVTFSVSANDTGKERKTEIVIKPKEGSLKLTISVTQSASKLSLSKENLYFDRNNGNQTITVTEDLNKWEVESSSATWCTYSINGNALTIRVTATTQDRQATIKFKNRSETIKVYQSKYAVGDTYNEKGVTGTVGYMQDGLNYIYKDVGYAVWSTENVATGATDQNDGRNNMAVIKKIANWKELYPAFALCDALNTGSVTGWYFPAHEEIFNSDKGTFWTSTESSSNLAYYRQQWSYPARSDKSSNIRVFAVHRF